MTTADTVLPFQFVPDLATLVTVKVTEVTLREMEVDTEQVPVVPVVHVFVPLAPADSCPVTVVPDTGVAVAAVTVVVALAVQDRLALIADPVMVAWVVVGGGGAAARRVERSRLGEPARMEEILAGSTTVLGRATAKQVVPFLRRTGATFVRVFAWGSAAPSVVTRVDGSLQWAGAAVVALRRSGARRSLSGRPSGS